MEPAVNYLLKAKFRPYFIFGAFYAAICAAGIGFVLHATNRLLESYALLEAADWTRDIAANLADLPDIARGDKAEAGALLFFEHARRWGRVSAVGIYDASGRLQLKSSDRPGDDPLSTALPEFASALANGTARVTAKRGVIGEEPVYYSIALTPIMDGRSLAGWIETVIDQTDRRDLFLSSTATIAMTVGLLLALGPAAGFWYRTRQKKRAELQLAYFSRHDTLTGQLNRPAWMTAVEEFVAGLEPGAEGMAVMHIHLGGVASANGIHGNVAGDHLLSVTARRLGEAAQHDALIARISGDKFGILLKDVDAIAAARAAKAMIAGATLPIDWQGRSLATHISIGIALHPHDGNNQSSLSKAADLSLTMAREAGQSCYRFFDPSIEIRAAKLRELERIVAEACEKNYLELHYQPVYELRSGKLNGFEALLRLKHPQKGYIPPAEFIPVAERTGEIDRIGIWCLEEACATAVNWPSDITVSVNLSPLQFDSGSLIGTLRRVFDKTRFPAYQLELEITEGLLLGDSDAVRTQLTAMNDMGIRIVLDDFGTGYSSFTYLWKFPFAKIKIDQAFVRAMEENASVLGIVRTIILLGRSLGLPVTAEGIEAPSQAALLRRLRCDLGQGYLFSRPVPATEVARLIMAHYAGTLHRPAPAEGTAAIATRNQERQAG